MHKVNFKIILSFLLILSINFIFSQKKFTIVLDAGHGGNDHGANRTYADIGRIAEKDITLAITLKVGAMLEKNKDFKVIYTGSPPRNSSSLNVAVVHSLQYTLPEG